MKSGEEQRPADAATAEPRSDLPVDPRWTLVQTVVQDDSFRRAPRLTELLLFVTERAIAGHTQELNEHDIAIAVFRRPSSFHSADDSIVRSSARQLRTKLHEYFEGAGRNEPVLIEIPKGSYIPEFPSRITASPAPVPSPVEPATRAFGLWKPVAIASSLVALTLAILLIRQSTVPATPEQIPRPPNLVTWLFGKPGQEVNVVLCDSALVVVNSYRPHIVTLDDYIQQREQQPLPLPTGNPAGATPPEFPGKRLITSFRDIPFVERLSELSAAGGFRVGLKHSRLMQVRDFRTGNHILLGSAWSNPWTTLFEDRLTFRFTEASGTGSFGLENTSPQKGQQRFYQCSPAQAHNGTSYARIAIVPNLSGQHAILLISGLHTESSEGALDAVLAPVFLEQIRQITGARTPEELSGLELVVAVRAVDGVVHDTRLVTSRYHRKE